MTEQQFINQNGNFEVNPATMLELQRGLNRNWFIKCAHTGNTILKGTFEQCYQLYIGA